MKFGSVDLSSVLSVAVQGTFMVDIGTDVSTITTYSNSILAATSSTASSVVTDILALANEIVVTASGTLTVNFATLSDNIIPNLVVTLGAADFLYTNGNGRTGLAQGFYATISNNIAADIGNWIVAIVDEFAPILSELGISSVTVPTSGISLGLFVNSSTFGFAISFPGIAFNCLFKFSGNNLSCSVGGSFFTLLVDGANYVIKKASEFFDETGSTIETYTTASWDSAVTSLSDTVEAAKGVALSTAKTITAATSTVAKALTSVVSSVSSVVSKIIKKFHFHL